MRLFFALIAGAACFALACSDDDPAPQTGIGGAGNTELDASVRDLPGDGLEPTPDFDTESRQRDPIGPEQLVDEIDRIRNENGQGGSSSDAPDAAVADADVPDGGAN